MNHPRTGYFEHMANAALLPKTCAASQDTEIPITEADLFPHAWEALVDESRFQAWFCSRRAAKTATLIRRTAKRSHERPGWRTLFIHHTRTLGKQQFYETGDPIKNPGVRELLRSHHIAEAHHDQTELNVRLANGSFVQVVGCDDARDVGKKLGFQWNDIIIDECQEFKDPILTRLVDKTILPTLIDRGGSLTLSGTPSDVEDGLWFKTISDPAKCGCSMHHWTLLDNPFIDREYIVSTMKMRGFVINFLNPDDNDVMIRREIFGQQVIDPLALLYCYRKGINDWPASGVPNVDSPNWRYAMGIDIGGANEGNDRDAVVVWGWQTNDPEHLLWEREAWEAREMDSEEFVELLLATYHRWRPIVSVCADTGGAGAGKALKRFSTLAHGLVFEPKPTSVELSTRLLNDEFRSGRARVNPLGIIARDAKICTKVETYHSDIMAAARYGHHGVANFLAKEEPKPKDPNTDEAIRQRRREQWTRELHDRQNPWSNEGGWQQ